MKFVVSLEAKSKKFITYIPNSEEIINKINKADSKVEVMPAKETSGWVTFFTSIIPFVIIFILFFFLLNQAQGGGSRVMNFGKSQRRSFIMMIRKRFVLEM